MERVRPVFQYSRKVRLQGVISQEWSKNLWGLNSEPYAIIEFGSEATPANDYAAAISSFPTDSLIWIVTGPSTGPKASSNSK
jgi:hypothetical protein